MQFQAEGMTHLGEAAKSPKSVKVKQVRLAPAWWALRESSVGLGTSSIRFRRVELVHLAL